MDLLLPPEEKLPEFTPVEVDLSVSHPELFELFRQLDSASVEDAAVGSWQASGSGPQPLMGGQWVKGEVLAPLSTPPKNALIDTITYDYSNKNFGSWWRQISVRITIYTPLKQWIQDVTTHDRGLLNVSSLKIPAICKMVYEMKVGNIVVRLSQPPYINWNTVRVVYA